MRIVFTGTSGNDKRHVVNRIASHFRDKHHHSVRIVEAEAELYKLTQDRFYEFLDAIPSNEAVRLWSGSLKAAITNWKEDEEKAQADFSFLCLHSTYHVRSHLYCPLNWSYPDRPGSVARGELLDALREFSPDLFVNIFDNVYSVQARIRDYPFRLIELLRWRDIEKLATDVLASLVITDTNRIRERPDHMPKYKYERSPIVAIRHPLEMIYRLVSDEKVPRIYMAYPISEPRRRQQKTGNQDLIHQINKFRKSMSHHFVAFDPVTIDERPIKLLWDRFAESKRKLKSSTLKKSKLLAEFKTMAIGDVDLELKESDLWSATKTEYQDMMCGPLNHYRKALRPASAHGKKTKPDTPVTFRLPAGEIRRAVEEKQFWAGTAKGGEIDNQIVRRDYRLIDQSDCVVIYRPTMNRSNEWQLGGTRSEYQYAKDSGKPALVIWDKADGPLEDPPFNTKVNPMDVLEWANLDSSETAQKKCFAKAVADIRRKIHGNMPELK